jgi:hypothetical protein
MKIKRPENAAAPGTTGDGSTWGVDPPRVPEGRLAAVAGGGEVLVGLAADDGDVQAESRRPRDRIDARLLFISSLVLGWRRVRATGSGPRCAGS